MIHANDKASAPFRQLPEGKHLHLVIERYDSQRSHIFVMSADVLKVCFGAGAERRERADLLLVLTTPQSVMMAT